MKRHLAALAVAASILGVAPAVAPVLDGSAVLLAVPWATPAQAAAPIRECGDPDGRGGARNLTTRVWTCAQGRDMVRAWKRGYKGRGVRWAESVTVRGRTTVTDVRATMRGGYVTRFQFYGVAYGG